MAGLPGQTRDAWRSSLEFAAASGAQHISAYDLVRAHRGDEEVVEESRTAADEAPVRPVSLSASVDAVASGRSCFRGALCMLMSALILEKRAQLPD